MFFPDWMTPKFCFTKTFWQVWLVLCLANKRNIFTLCFLLKKKLPRSNHNNRDSKIDDTMTKREQDKKEGCCLLIQWNFLAESSSQKSEGSFWWASLILVMTSVKNSNYGECWSMWGFLNCLAEVSQEEIPEKNPSRR